MEIPDPSIKEKDDKSSQLIASYEEEGKKLTQDTFVQTEDEEPDIAHNSSCTKGRMVKEKAIQVEIPDPLIKVKKDKLAQLIA